MDILERLQITLSGGLDSWPTASIEWEYGKAIEEIKKLTADRDKYKALCDQMGIALDKVLSTHDYHTDDGAESTCEAIKALDAWKEMK